MISLQLSAIHYMQGVIDSTRITVNTAIDNAAEENDCSGAVILCDTLDALTAMEAQMALVWDMWCERAWSHVVANPFCDDGGSESLVINA